MQSATVHGNGNVDIEQERSANACHVAAGVLQSLGEALGPQNEDSDTFLRWASELQTHVRHLRARSPSSDEHQEPASSLRLVQ